MDTPASLPGHNLRQYGKKSGTTPVTFMVDLPSAHGRRLCTPGAYMSHCVSSPSSRAVKPPVAGCWR
ncbi:hypothetical protein SGPA1_12403 [Streptomyces misionensis JCM 4497]